MATMLAPVRGDTLPDGLDYLDNGCEVSDSCLSCPLPVCKYDDPGWHQRETRRARDEALVRARQEQGLGISELAERFGVSERTVHRVLKNSREPAPQTRRDIEDHGPRISLEELERRSFFRPRTPFPPLRAAMAYQDRRS